MCRRCRRNARWLGVASYRRDIKKPRRLRAARWPSSGLLPPEKCSCRKSPPGQRSLGQARSSSPISAMALATSAFARLCQFNDRQPCGGAHQAEQAQGIFQGGRAFLGERGRQRRHPTVAGIARTATVPAGSSKRWPGTDPGATFEIVDMQPSPPLAIKASAVASSPDNSRNPVGSSDRKRSGRVISPVASLKPMNCLRLRQPRQRVVGQFADRSARECRAG